MNANTLVISLFLFAGSAFFVCAEYALLSAKRVKIQSLADKGSSAARMLLRAMDQRNKYVAGTQIGITLLSIAVGSVTEPSLSEGLSGMLHGLPKTAISVISILAISYPLVVLAELVPKYITIRQPERMALALIRPLVFWGVITRPLIWLFEGSGSLVLRIFGIDPTKAESEALSRDELQIILQAGEEEGQFDEQHADVLLRALRLDKLKTGSVMIHRLDIQSLQGDLSGEGLILALEGVSHSRIPIYGSDMDDIRGIVYLQDVVRILRQENPVLSTILRPAEFVPENLSLDRALRIMRQNHTQILIVQDEYGGTSGMLTLEDIVEEVLGDLEDQPETERPDLELATPNRLKMTPYVRWDEVLDFLDLPIPEETSTETVAQIVQKLLQKVPSQGDSVETELGRLVVDQTTRRRLIQLSLYLHNPVEPDGE